MSVLNKISKFRINNKINYIVLTGLVLMSMTSFKTDAVITFNPDGVNTNKEHIYMYITFGGATVTYKKLYTQSQAFPSSGMYTKTESQSRDDFMGTGTWYMHCHNVSTGEKRTSKPLNRDLATPLNPTIGSSYSGPIGNAAAWNKSNVSVPITNNGDRGSANWTAGVNRIEYSTGSGWVRYGSPLTFTNEGTYSLSARVIDNVGNISETVTKVFGIDKTLPSISGAPSSAWTNGNVAINMSASDGRSGMSSVILKKGGSQVTSGATSVSYTETTEGRHSFSVVAKDKADNQATKDFSINIDKSGPTVNVSQSPTGWTNGNVTISSTASDGLSGISGITKPDGGWVGGGSASQSVSGNGTYTFVGRDNVGNTTSKSITVSNIDKTAPSLSISNNPSSWVGSATLTATASDGQSGVNKIILPNGTEVKGTSATFNVTANGTYTFKAVDNVGNTVTQQVTVSKIDKVPPTINIGGNINAWFKGEATFNIQASDSNSGINRIEYSLSGATSAGWTRYSSPVRITNEGVTNIQARAYDNSGNVSGTVTATVKIDNTIPNGAISAPGTTTNRVVNISFTGLSDSLSGLKEVRLSNKSDFSDTVKVVNVSGKTSTTVSFELDKKGSVADNYKTRTVYARLYDNVGNYRAMTVQINLLPIAPKTPIIVEPIAGNPLYLANEKVNVIWQYDDINTDFGKLPQQKAEIQLTNTDTGEVKKYTVTGQITEFTLKDLEKGNYTVSVTVYNWSNIKSVSAVVPFRVGIYNPNGNVRTMIINNGSPLSYIKIVTNYEIPVGTKIEGRYYYKVKSDGTIDESVYKTFILSKNDEVIRLPEKTSKLQIEYRLSRDNGVSPELTPILDNITVYGK